MGERVDRAAKSRGGRKVLATHGESVARAADTAAISAGLGWWILNGLFLLVVVISWVSAAFLRSSLSIGVAVAVTLAILPPLIREWRKRHEIRRAIRGD